MTERYYIATPIAPGNFAGTKARQDIEALAERRGLRRIEFAGGSTADRRPIERVRLAWLGLRNWIRLERTVAPASLVLFQYPHYPMKSAMLARFMMRRIRRVKRVRFAALVHDLNSARKSFGRAARYSDARFLPQFDFVICHNERMRGALAARGIAPERLIPLGVFDYLCEGGAPADAPYAPSVNVAGNLSREKSAYLYALLLTPRRYRVYLYGAGLDAAAGGESASYEGFAPPERLPRLLKGAFGLVWDGDSLDTCAGGFGVYLALNNPHKLSLSLSAGLPVVIWSGASLAPYVEEHGLGLCVGSLRELDAALEGVSAEDYRSMRQNAAREGEKIRGGYYFDRAMDVLERRCFKEFF